MTVTEPALLSLQIAVAGPTTAEELVLTLDGSTLPTPREIDGGYGGRVHIIKECAPGALVVGYAASVEGTYPIPAPPGSEEHDRIVQMRPSRYCPSDKLLSTANHEFGDIEDTGKLIDAVRDRVNGRLLYIGGSSKPTDDAVDTLLLGEGVCRDYAQRVVSLLRARDVPARLVAVYAPGLSPMDFHAVVEAWTGPSGGSSTRRGSRPGVRLLRISTGRDASDTAFLTTYHGGVDLNSMMCTAVVDELPAEDPAEALSLG